MLRKCLDGQLLMAERQERLEALGSSGRGGRDGSERLGTLCWELFNHLDFNSHEENIQNPIYKATNNLHI